MTATRRTTTASRNGAARKTLPPKPIAPTLEERVTKLEAQVNALVLEWRKFTAQLILQNPQVQQRLTDELLERMSQEEGKK